MGNNLYNPQVPPLRGIRDSVQLHLSTEFVTGTCNGTGAAELRKHLVC